jgi:hypothetical protein
MMGGMSMAKRWRAGIALVALGVSIAALIAATGSDPDGGPPRLQKRELSAEGLADSIGVSVHLNSTDTAYRRRDELLTRLKQLGIRHIRSPVPSPPGGALTAGLLAARAGGIRATLGTGDIDRDPALAVVDSLTVMGTSIDAFEGPNELDNSGDPAWAATLSRYMPAFAAAIERQAPSVPLIGPSLVHPDSRQQLPRDLPGLLNDHPYPGGKPPEPVLGDALRRLAKAPGRRPIIFSETGYHNAMRDDDPHRPVSERAAAVYMPRLLLTAYGAGVRRTYIYELLDEKRDPGLQDLQQHFGLVRYDMSPKPAFTAVRTLIAVLRASSGGSSSQRPLRWRLEGDGTGDVQRLTFVRRDGSRVLALWRAVSVWDRDELRDVRPPSLRAELRLSRRARDVTVWRPSRSMLPTLSRRSATHLPLELEGDVVLVSLR